MTLRPGVLIDHTELMTRPTTGAAWNAVLNVAKGSLGTPNVSDMNSSHDVKTVGCALAAMRLGDAALKTKATNALTAAIGTEEDIRWLELGRNLGGYIVAADLLDIRSGPIHDWLAKFMTITHPDNNGAGRDTIQQSAWSSGSNASAQVGFVHAALSVYLNDAAALEWGWMAFRRYCGDRTSTWKLQNTDGPWQVNNNDTVGIQNKGATITGINVDGAISNDMARSNPKPVANIVWTDKSHYPWVGMNGAALAAEVFSRQGYLAYDIVDKAILRAATYLHNLAARDSGWYDAGTRKDAKYIINKRYGVTYPLTLPVGANGLVGFTDFMG